MTPPKQTNRLKMVRKFEIWKKKAKNNIEYCLTNIYEKFERNHDKNIAYGGQEIKSLWQVWA